MLGFKLTTFRLQVSSHNHYTRAHILKQLFIQFSSPFIIENRFKPRTAGLQAPTNPLSYGRWTPPTKTSRWKKFFCTFQIHSIFPFQSISILRNSDDYLISFLQRAQPGWCKTAERLFWRKLQKWLLQMFCIHKDATAVKLSPPHTPANVKL